MPKTRILEVMHMPFDRNLGGPKACIELIDEVTQDPEWTAEWFTLSDVVPSLSGVTRFFAGSLFHNYAARHVKQKGRNYDVVIAEHGNLTISKETLGFDGLLVARTSGLAYLLRKNERELNIRLKSPGGCSLKFKLLNTFHEILSGGLRAVARSYRNADLAIVLNPDEAEFLRRNIPTKNPPVIIPNGLPTKTLRRLAETASGSGRSVTNKPVLAFIGRWSILKGCKDIPPVFRLIRKALPDCRLKLLGVFVDEKTVLEDFDDRDRAHVEVLSSYDNKELPSQLANVTLGIFPSYSEGFGFAVLEMIAAGIPCVSYNIAGPRHILCGSLSKWLVNKGDLELLAETVLSSLRCTPSAYEDAKQACLQAAARFDLTSIACEWKRIIADALERNRN